MATIKDKTEADLKHELGEKKLALRSFRFGSSGSKAKNVKEARNVRKEVARILTELNARKKAQA